MPEMSKMLQQLHHSKLIKFCEHDDQREASLSSRWSRAQTMSHNRDALNRSPIEWEREKGIPVNLFVLHLISYYWEQNIHETVIAHKMYNTFCTLTNSNCERVYWFCVVCAREKKTRTESMETKATNTKLRTKNKEWWS